MPPDSHALPDQIALFHLFCSGSTLISDYVQQVSFDGEQFITFAMAKSGATVLAQVHVIDMDMTFACTCGSINMVKVIVFNAVTKVATMVAHAWVDWQDALTYCAIMLALFQVFAQHTGCPLHFSAFDWVNAVMESEAHARLTTNSVLPISIDAI